MVLLLEERTESVCFGNDRKQSLKWSLGNTGKENQTVKAGYVHIEWSKIFWERFQDLH